MYNLWKKNELIWYNDGTAVLTGLSATTGHYSGFKLSDASELALGTGSFVDQATDAHKPSTNPPTEYDTEDADFIVITASFQPVALPGANSLQQSDFCVYAVGVPTGKPAGLTLGPPYEDDDIAVPSTDLNVRHHAMSGVMTDFALANGNNDLRAVGDATSEALCHHQAWWIETGGNLDDVSTIVMSIGYPIAFGGKFGGGALTSAGTYLSTAMLSSFYLGIRMKLNFTALTVASVKMKGYINLMRAYVR